MFQKIKLIGFYLVLLSLVFSSCSEYQKILKSSDYELKFEKAKEYYEDEDYARAISLFDELLSIYKGTSKAEDIYFYYASCHYGQKDYILAGHYYRNFARTFPLSTRAEEAEYIGAYCYFLDSPKYSLDQTFTLKAIEEMQYFINKHPESERIGEANEIIDKLRGKLEKKSFKSARLYFDLGNYKAAIVALKNSLKEFPDSEFREETLFLIVKSNFLLASNSVTSKKKERYNSTIDEYYIFANAFPKSEKNKEAKKIYENSKEFVEK
ncbi:MAG: outer membrane protein assembly factor BamD [Bacteroidota bacterium]|nr:outer membrane protein assembly factor BamD [Bacteroidota bacterium]